MEDKNKYLKEYINKVAISVNESFPNLIDDNKIKKAIDMFSNRDEDISVIKKQIEDLINKIIQDRLEKHAMYDKIIVDNMEQRSLEELKQFTLDLGNGRTGLYLSQQQIDLLMITELSSKEELNNYILNVTYQFTNEDAQRIIEECSILNLESAKRKVYDEYLKTLDSYIDDAVMSNREQIISKLTKLGINSQEQEMILNYIDKNGINKTLLELRQSKGEQFIVKLNRLMCSDFENVKIVGYDYMSALSRLISRDKSIDTLIIATGKYNDMVYSNGTEKYFDSYFTDKALSYCEKHNLHMRYHTLFDYSHIEALLKQGKTKEDKEQILSLLKDYVQRSFKYINEHNKTLPDGSKLINVIEIFNELVERNKSSNERNQPYLMKWEKEFGITINDLMNCFEGIKKPDGVEFMYNETTLTESSFKRKKVEDVFDEIERIQYGFIDIFGDQSHLSDEDLENEGKEVKETAAMLKRIQDKGKKIEITEHDFHFSKRFINYYNEEVLKEKYKLEDIKTIKKNIQDKISGYYKDAGIDVEIITYWNLFDKNDHNLVRVNKEISQENKNKNGNIVLIEDMYAGVLGDGGSTNEILSLSSKIQVDNLSKPKTLIRSNNPENRGFINVITLSLIISFVVGTLFMLIYYLVK